MSSILKALRKLEEERSCSKEGSPDIARDILKSGPRRKPSPWMLHASILVLGLAFGVSGYLLSGRVEFPPLPEASQTLVEMPPAKVHLPVEKTPLTPPGTPEGAAEIPPESNPLVGFPPKETSMEILSPPPLPAAKKFVRKPAKPEPSPDTAPSGKVPAKEAADPLPSLVLTGIAFHEGESRLAVVNNLPVMEGTMIAGARVVEISEDRVRFDFSGRSFEVLLDEPTATR